MSVVQADPSREFVEFWNEILEPKFTRFRHVLVGGLGKHSEIIFPKLPMKEGDHVLDVGCGFGDTAIQIARKVGPNGSVIGIDCVQGFIALANKDAREAGVDNVSFVVGDAQTETFQPEYDHLFSRFGTMFFANPVAGLRNIRTGLKPGGTLSMIVWRTIDDNPWLKLPKTVTLEHLPPPGDDARTCGPGPFSMADPETVRAQLKAAGYAPDATFERIDAPLMVGNDIRDAIDFQIALGPAGEVYREAGDLAKERHAVLEEALTAALKPYATADGVVMGSSSWLITAHNPA